GAVGRSGEPGPGPPRRFPTLAATRSRVLVQPHPPRAKEAEELEQRPGPGAASGRSNWTDGRAWHTAWRASAPLTQWISDPRWPGYLSRCPGRRTRLQHEPVAPGLPGGRLPGSLGPHCPHPRFYLPKRHRKVCGNPKNKEVQRAMKLLDARNKIFAKFRHNTQTFPGSHAAKKLSSANSKLPSSKFSNPTSSSKRNASLLTSANSGL
uniref:C-C motif chemokine ligand 25 n=1 Tax=Macaca mulatta TaxID=9544 RepID=A0A5F8ABM4_MACMU